MLALRGVVVMAAISGCAQSPWLVVSAISVPNPVMFGPIHRLGAPPTDAELAVQHGMFVTAPLYAANVDDSGSTVTVHTTQHGGQRFGFELVRRLFEPDGLGPVNIPRQAWEEPYLPTDTICIEALWVGTTASSSIGQSSLEIHVNAPGAYYFHLAGTAGGTP